MLTYKATIEKPRLIIHPSDGCNPRENDNLGAIVTSHRRYVLGDKQLGYVPGATSWREAMAYYFAEDAGVNPDKYKEKIDKIWKWIDNNVIWLPVYMYDHSGITLNTTGFSCGWDSGQLGFIYTTKEKAKKWFNVRRITNKIKEKVEQLLESEIEQYDKYLNGDYYKYILFDENGIIMDAGDCYPDLEAIKEELPEEFKNEDLNQYLKY